MATSAEITDAQTQLVTVNAAIEQLLQNKRVTNLEIGSGMSRRVYTFQEITMELLLGLKSQLQTIIRSGDTLEVTTAFRNAVVFTDVKKRAY